MPGKSQCQQALHTRLIRKLNSAALQDKASRNVIVENWMFQADNLEVQGVACTLLMDGTDEK